MVPRPTHIVRMCEPLCPALTTAVFSLVGVVFYLRTKLIAKEKNGIKETVSQSQSAQKATIWNSCSWIQT